MKLLQRTRFGGKTNTFPARLISLTNRAGLNAQFTNYGARWVSMFTPDRNGKLDDILLGFDTLSGYIHAGEQYYGAIIGRVCGRINNACFTLNGKTYNLAANDAYGFPEPNHLHGGINAFHNRYWQWHQFVNKDGDEAVTFSLHSANGEEGYPGNLNVRVTYTLKASNALCMECEAISDQQTPVNLTNHAFFNLQGTAFRKNVLSHLLTLNASNIIECDSELIPTGRFIPVADTQLDFRNPRIIGNSFTQNHSQVLKDKGFSIAFALDVKDTPLHFAARLKDELTGRKMEIYTNQPSIQVYTAYFMDGTDIGKKNCPYYASAGVALETQGFPDAPNQKMFPSVFLEKNDVYYHQTKYIF